ncbi:hypothetical protein NPS70_17555 [Streptomyces sp. C10-9-1]|uniref:hypothetical protein n=1 Tax=Streptomyces sp. C10-9-1 TaxID=1859285 RepID=UPI002110EE98|nr:hypothetical protein [Streptomyces sp. C10-9-1]MCQ6554985.1 hypothetical protein [Streptomyces sp. C10-9-1]
MRAGFRREATAAAVLAALFASAGATAAPASVDRLHKNHVLVVGVHAKGRAHVGPDAVEVALADRRFTPGISLKSSAGNVSWGRFEHLSAVRKKAVCPVGLPVDSLPRDSRENRPETVRLLNSEDLGKGKVQDSPPARLPGLFCGWSGLSAPGAFSSRLQTARNTPGGPVHALNAPLGLHPRTPAHRRPADDPDGSPDGVSDDRVARCGHREAVRFRAGEDEGHGAVTSSRTAVS